MGLAPGVADGSARDLAPGDAGADVVLRAVGVERDLRSIEDAQQLALAAMEPRDFRVRPISAGMIGRSG